MADAARQRLRIVTVRDSYVYCLQVKNGETWQDYLEMMRNDVEFLNFGIPGGGVDQAYLRWLRDGRKFNPDIVILGIWPDNVIRDLMITSCYRGQSGVAHNKPRLILEHVGGSRFVNYPTMRGGLGCLNRISASISGASAGVRLPSGGAAA